MRRLLLLTALVAAAPALAQTTPAPAPKAIKDPNRVICKGEDVVGSRLQTKKTCRTAAEWEQYQRDMRLTTDRVQAMKTYQGG